MRTLFERLKDEHKVKLIANPIYWNGDDVIVPLKNNIFFADLKFGEAIQVFNTLEQVEQFTYMNFVNFFND